jgi:eukaryotic-like serine/threonine-protein kinase
MKVLDLGIAKVMSDTSNTTKLFAETGHALRAFSPHYGTPEQFDARLGATGPWTDGYALALILVELVAGRAAYAGQDLPHLLREALDPQRPTLRARGVRASDPVERVIARALAVQPRERYVRAGDFWDQLEVAARDISSDATAWAPMEQAVAPKRDATVYAEPTPAPFSPPISPPANPHPAHYLQTGQGTPATPAVPVVAAAPIVSPPVIPPNAGGSEHPPHAHDDDDEPRGSGWTWFFVIVVLLGGTAAAVYLFALPYIDPDILRAIGIEPPGSVPPPAPPDPPQDDGEGAPAKPASAPGTASEQPR